MYQPIRFKTTLRLILLFIAFACFGLAPVAHAVSPPPDGGYAGFNTAEGTSALFNLTSGLFNTAVGYQALFHNTTGTNNTGVGYRSLFFNSTGNQNIALGYAAGAALVSGDNNIYVGDAGAASGSQRWQRIVSTARTRYSSPRTRWARSEAPS